MTARGLARTAVRVGEDQLRNFFGGALRGGGGGGGGGMSSSSGLFGDEMANGLCVAGLRWGCVKEPLCCLLSPPFFTVFEVYQR